LDEAKVALTKILNNPYRQALKEKIQASKLNAKNRGEYLDTKQATKLAAEEILYEAQITAAGMIITTFRALSPPNSVCLKCNIGFGHSNFLSTHMCADSAADRELKIQCLRESELVTQRVFLAGLEKQHIPYHEIYRFMDERNNLN